MKHSFKFFFLFLTVILSCKKTETKDCDDSLSLYSKAEFPIGVAIEPYDLLAGTRNLEIVSRQFNSITAENVFKPNNLHPSQNTFNWTEADEMVNFAIAESKRIHGHTLIWHNQLPPWMNSFEGSTGDWEQIFKDHIQSICHHFKGKISSWDVINEAFTDDGNLRNTIWKQNIGASYLEKAFLYAHEADPSALLFYNDYDLVLNEKKRRAVIQFIKKLQQRNIPIHGIGLQMHISIIHPDNSSIAEAFQEFSELGIKIHLSELDISINPLSKSLNLTDELLEKQANKMAIVSYHYQQIPKSLRYGISFWGHSDAHSWIRSFFNREDYPLLFDDNYEAKPVYCKFYESL